MQISPVIESGSCKGQWKKAAVKCLEIEVAWRRGDFQTVHSPSAVRMAPMTCEAWGRILDANL